MLPARHWELKAEEARAVAGQMRFPSAVECMLSIADHYERMARLSAAIEPAKSGAK